LRYIPAKIEPIRDVPPAEKEDMYYQQITESDLAA